MTAPLPVQKFRLGDRVQPSKNKNPFVIDMVRASGLRVEYRAIGRMWFGEKELTLAPEQPPYEPSQRRTLTRRETDAEMDARHAIERAEYDAQEAKP